MLKLGINPSKILCLTYSTAAACEMKKRVLEWEPCLTRECKFYYDGGTLAFQEEDL